MKELGGCVCQKETHLPQGLTISVTHSQPNVPHTSQGHKIREDTEVAPDCLPGYSWAREKKLWAQPPLEFVPARDLTFVLAFHKPLWRQKKTGEFLAQLHKVFLSPGRRLELCI